MKNNTAGILFALLCLIVTNLWYEEIYAQATTNNTYTGTPYLGYTSANPSRF
jgi:hypothetical protein